ncbi:flavin reductase family protein [Rhodococcus koreensis]
MIGFESVGDPARLREAFGCFPSGVIAVCALSEGVPVGMAASSFTSVSVAPALVSVCVQHSSTTWPILRGLRRLGISVLAEGHDAECLQLSRKNTDRFYGVSWTAGEHGSVFIDDSSARLDCELYKEVDAGDHSIAILEVKGLAFQPEKPPLVFHRSSFQRLQAS